MRLRVTRTVRSHNATQARGHNDADIQEHVEGMLVLYRVPSAGGVSRWAPAASSFEGTLDMGHRLAILLESGPTKHLWFTSPVVEYRVRPGGGWIVRTENSTYKVESLQEGLTPRRVRTVTGSFPIYDPTPTED